MKFNTNMPPEEMALYLIDWKGYFAVKADSDFWLIKTLKGKKDKIQLDFKTFHDLIPLVKKIGGDKGATWYGSTR